MFSDIKVGDSVLVEVEAREEWQGGMWFKVKRTVDRVTPKQFEVKGKKYRKSDGVCVGDSGHVTPYNVEEDQTDGYAARIDIIRLHRAVVNNRIPITEMESLTTDQLNVLRQVFMK